jgi:hypothetical protein
MKVMKLTHVANAATFLATVVAAALLPMQSAAAQSTRPSTRTQHWTVRPEWVRAHEAFLASDAMRGRGSATHDEEVAATYVASEFMAYGLKPAPGMTGFIQRAPVVRPELTGAGTLSVGDVTLHEGSDFDVLLSAGAPVSGTFRNESNAQGNSTTPLAGEIVLARAGNGDALSAVRPLLQRGASVVLVPESGSADTLAIQMGGKARVTARLASAPAAGAGPTIVIVHPAAVERLAHVAAGTRATLDVHTLANPAPQATYNAIGYLEGTDPSSGTILLSAHLDHLGVGRPVAGDSIYNGANDDAAGTTAVMELAHALAAGPRPRRNILFVCYGSEEIGELGSTYFGEHPPVPLSSLVANLEFEMIGSQDPKTTKGTLLFTGWDRSNLGPMLRAHGALLGPDPYPDQHFFERSDNYALALQGVVAHTAAGWGTPPTYHEVDDDLAHLDIGFMTSAIQSLIEPVRWLATSNFTPAWNPGGRPQRGAH